MNYADIRDYLYNACGDCGYEAILDAINFYLMNCEEFPCESDKLFLLGMLFHSGYAEGYYREHNALLNAKIVMPKEKGVVVVE